MTPTLWMGSCPPTTSTSHGGAGLPDYPKPGFNKDAIFVEFNDFATTGAGHDCHDQQGRGLRRHAPDVRDDARVPVPGHDPGADERRHDRRGGVVLLDRRQRHRRRHHAGHEDDQLLQQQPDVSPTTRSRSHPTRPRSRPISPAAPGPPSRTRRPTRCSTSTACW